MSTEKNLDLVPIKELVYLCKAKQEERIKKDILNNKTSHLASLVSETRQPSAEAEKSEENSLLEVSSPSIQTDTFFAINAPDAPVKNDLGSMEHPMFALKPGDTKTRHYSYNGNNIEIKSGPFGIATQFDKDILIYCLSQIMTAINYGKNPGRNVRIKAYELLQYLNRDSGGKGYAELKSSFDRLDGTRLKTNIKSGGHSVTSWFGLVESIDISYSSDNKKRMSHIDITISQWLYSSAISKEVLTMNDNYFGIRSPLKRRLYEIARKHCGKTQEWSITPENLYLKSGSSCSRKEFNRSLREISLKNDLPDYSMSYTHTSSSPQTSKRVQVVFKPKVC